MSTFGEWESEVLDHAYEHVDYLSLHAYFEQGTNDAGTFLASAQLMDGFIDGVVATVDHVRSKKRSKKQLKLSFDEWNLWDESRFVGQANLEWAEAPRLIEETYDVQDAVVFGNLLMSLLRHVDRVDIACLAQLVNVIAPIRAEASGPAWRQTIFYPFALTARHARGEVLQVSQVSATYPTAYGEANAADVVATSDARTGEVTVFAVNRHQEEHVTVSIDVRAFDPLKPVEHVYLGGAELTAANTEQAPERVSPRHATAPTVRAGEVQLTLPPISWNMLRLAPTSR